ncbi:MULTISPECIES: sigma-54-dependent transcriptional regulator [Rhodopirellula]|jgi:two-component system NtrC family response regulator|uniref:Two component, sigma54 specific, transcriptional regulator, Fis family n=1 Tax=Rhodopirellula europaea SH398 TaxID=1263868 RepID=M5SNA5_9BACT|nr:MULTISPECIES: sigma-54 dependent transcriptional regulator [Rhodopirellula]EMI27739.1 two component, sigma54 specific, transcriptional regulator, Fis family [Rhodopirellula europaea SH398]
MNRSEFSVLIVDDEPNIRSGLQKGLVNEADRIETAANAEEGLATFESGVYQLVIADVRLGGGMDGIELLGRIRHLDPEVAVIVITAHGTVETAVDAMRAGAFDFISKPLDLNLVRQQVRKAREHRELRQENQSLRTRLADAGELSNIIGQCAAMQDVFHQIRQVAATEATVMIQGESGSGKELVARALHDLSDRSGGPFVAVNLGAMPETLLESELFGHEKGSFSGASRQKPGCFEQATGGTLFLDEVTEMSAKSQVDLLRVLESRRFTRVGGEKLLETDVRVVSATNKSVPELIQDGTFREDLYYRLNVIPIEVPSLRQRRDDIPLLIEHFLQHFCTRHGRPMKQIAPDAMRVLVGAQWPGNVRQLRNLVERLVVTHTGDVIDSNELPADLQPATTDRGAKTLPASLSEAVENCEREMISTVLAECDFHRENTAKRLGVSVRTLHYKMGRYGLH